MRLSNDFQTTFWRTGDITTLVEQLCDFVREIQTTFQRLLNDFRLRPWKLFRLSKRLSKF
uniref:Cyclic nucleotide-gated cation channel protein n=1 Tax=Siphoviridae sp. ctmqu18 TaxID=2825655 RepID=A0A8S5V657_9CAUD|nr:MAG TPA: Cyclic nucleotide-gated cation channel protein [Siphoviridae sp. ctmqu18]